MDSNPTPIAVVEPRLGPNRYEWPHSADLLHLDRKKLGRMGSSSGWRFDRSQNGGATRLGWTYVHVAVDDHGRLAYVEELIDEHPPTTIGFVRRAIDFYAAHGVRISRLLTDNGTPYRSRAFAAAADGLQLRHVRTRPYTPRTTARPKRWSRS